MLLVEVLEASERVSQQNVMGVESTNSRSEVIEQYSSYATNG
jgi:hypothetical protein